MALHARITVIHLNVGHDKTNIKKNNCSYNLITSLTKLTEKNAQKPSGIFLILLTCAPHATSYS